ncbi:sensor histidine kinase [Nonomuraea jiangxiensis]|uniref:sensor histidine kinase n=1 Tax=Nonomuraea jiangxiensis TaxID=633440 RepID=UPI001FE51750|nr:histidine kinase [Nonomuraea jiangxiensis]
MGRVKRGLIAAAGVPLNAVMAVALVLAWAPRIRAGIVSLQRAWAGAALGRAIPARENGPRVLAWLAINAVVGPAFLMAMTAVVNTVGIIVHLRPAVNGPSVTFTLSLALLLLSALGLVVAALMGLAEARLAELLLGSGDSLAQRVRELTASRAAAVDARAAELRRIERDLHDGAQARLIAVRLNLGLARSADDPEQARELIEEAWESAGQALTDLRDLVRGIHPPVLADRGLAGAIEAAALLCPIPVATDLVLAGRPEPPVESALYFAAVEAMTNVTKHSQATRAWVRLRHTGDGLRLVVGDDGHGGADPAAGTGLRGIAERLSAFDGTLTVRSPPGGPTILTMELPCAL